MLCFKELNTVRSIDAVCAMLSIVLNIKLHLPAHSVNMSDCVMVKLGYTEVADSTK